MRRWAYLFLTQRDGSGCSSCQELAEDMHIHHRNGDHNDDAEDNLCILCQTCHTLAHGGDLESCVWERTPSRFFSPSPGIDLSDASPELRMSARMEPVFRTWVLEMVLKHTTISLDMALNGGAEYVHQQKGSCSVTTAKRYLAKLTSPTGPLIRTIDVEGITSISLKEEEIWYSKNGHQTPISQPEVLPLE